MREVVFNDFKVKIENGAVTVTGTIASSGFGNADLQRIAAAILHELSGIGDMNGKPIVGNVTINGTTISGTQTPM